MQSRLEDLKHFKGTQIWSDIQGVIGDIVESARGDLETEVDMDMVKRLQGEIIAYRRMMSIVDVMIYELEEERKQSNQQKKGEHDGTEGRD